MVKRVAHTKSLDIVRDEYLSWDKHIDYISKKLKNNIYVIKRACSVMCKIKIFMGVKGSSSEGCLK